MASLNKLPKPVRIARPAAAHNDLLDDFEDDHYKETIYKPLLDCPMFFKSTTTAQSGETTVTFIIPPEHRVATVYLSDALGYEIIARFYLAELVVTERPPPKGVASYVDE